MGSYNIIETHGFIVVVQHTLEVKSFLYDSNIDILVIVETHFSDTNYFDIPKCKIL